MKKKLNYYNQCLKEWDKVYPWYSIYGTRCYIPQHYFTSKRDNFMKHNLLNLSNICEFALAFTIQGTVVL